MDDIRENMEMQVKESLHQLPTTQQESEAVSRLEDVSNFYDYLSVTGIRVDRVEPGFVVCTFKVPPRLTDRAGYFASGAIANLVDVVGNSTVYYLGRRMNVSVDMTISFISKDELEITSKRLGEKGRYVGTMVLLRNKATGEIIAEGRHSLFRSNFVPKL